ncbi:hypothetical protein Vadar_006896 [Vaccinium darrowii]|uniref:Uncharacterized protein n=1 Tax=Vaccinium darrowii TaxID=229202 RepID=A0ACB7XXP6_9ERIC|nr:hypothetical protein Vadar_006896 [Vaccinium darrowii]
MAPKRTLGRRKIEMRLIESKQARQVTFSKRRFGLFKKASELCTLTGCEIALVVFSPSGKPFSFGHRCVNIIIRRFLCDNPMESAPNQDPHGSICSTLNQQYTELCAQLEAEKRRSRELGLLGEECQKPDWFDAPVTELSLDQLMESKRRMEELRDKIAERVNELSLVGSALALAPSNGARDIDLNVIPEEI